MSGELSARANFSADHFGGTPDFRGNSHTAMSADQTIDYEGLTQDAMRGIVCTILKRVHKHGLPGNHHFYIEFYTQAPGVSVSPRLKEKYPGIMTIVMQHRFWGLQVSDDKFEIKLTFDSIPERLVIPYSAIRVFFDPSVPYGLQFEDSEAKGEGARPGSEQAERAGFGDLSIVHAGAIQPAPQLNQIDPVDPPAPPTVPPVKKRPRRKTRINMEDEQAVPLQARSKDNPNSDNDSRPIADPAEQPNAKKRKQQEADTAKKASTAAKNTPQLLPEPQVEDADVSASDEEFENDAKSAKVVSLDAFRKK